MRSKGGDGSEFCGIFTRKKSDNESMDTKIKMAGIFQPYRFDPRARRFSVNCRLFSSSTGAPLSVFTECRQVTRSRLFSLFATS